MGSKRYEEEFMRSNLKVLHLILTLPFILCGCIPTLFAAGAGATVAAAKDQPIKETASDAKISASIKASFLKRGVGKLYAKISVDVVSGAALYTGSVSSEEDVATALEIAWDQEGVKEVINELKIDENSSKFDLVQYTRDSFITGQIKSKIFMNRDIKFPNYTIVTFNDVVYVFGLSRSEEEMERVTKIASEVKGVKKVVCRTKFVEIPNE